MPRILVLLSHPQRKHARVAQSALLPPRGPHGAHRADAAAIAAHAQVFADRLRCCPAWPEIDELPACVACEVPADARPEETLAAPAQPSI